MKRRRRVKRILFFRDGQRFRSERSKSRWMRERKRKMRKRERLKVELKKEKKICCFLFVDPESEPLLTENW